jgi:enoyl-CoA hydratase/carnithine racemase
MQHVDVKVHDNIATILLDRPTACNALSPQLMNDLMTALSDVHQEKRVRAVVLSGAGDHFCAGMDLKVMGEIASMPQSDAYEQWFTLWTDMTQLLEEILRFPKPVIAAVDGAAIGGGFALALAADCVVVSKRASFAVPAARRGIASGAVAALIAFRLGGAVAARMLLTGQPMDAAEAHRFGFCPSPVASDQIWVAATELARETTHGPREAVQAIKRQLNEDVGENLLTQLTAGAASSATSCTTESAIEAITRGIRSQEPGVRKPGSSS